MVLLVDPSSSTFDLKKPYYHFFYIDHFICPSKQLTFMTIYFEAARSGLPAFISIFLPSLTV